MNCKKYTQKEKNTCHYTYPNCPRHWICYEYIAHHRKKNELPACYFSKEKEKTYNRRIENR